MIIKDIHIKKFRAFEDVPFTLGKKSLRLQDATPR
jgi:predicted ATP-dependent endonuclease of OLD family